MNDIAIRVETSGIQNRNLRDGVSIRHQFIVALFFASTLVLTSSGRLGSSDVYGQLQASMLLVQSGKLSAGQPLPPFEGLWVKSPSGVYYEAHDIGNTLLFIPAALIGTVHDGGGMEGVLVIPLVSRVAAS